MKEEVDRARSFPTNCCGRVSPSPDQIAYFNSHPLKKNTSRCPIFYFTENITKYQGSTTDEADSYSLIRFSDFANDWNKWLSGLGNEKPKVTYKTAIHLQEAFKAKNQ